jgi:hypothetical protein
MKRRVIQDSDDEGGGGEGGAEGTNEEKDGGCEDRDGAEEERGGHPSRAAGPTAPNSKPKGGPGHGGPAAGAPNEAVLAARIMGRLQKKLGEKEKAKAAAPPAAGNGTSRTGARGGAGKADTDSRGTGDKTKKKTNDTTDGNDMMMIPKKDKSLAGRAEKADTAAAAPTADSAIAGAGARTKPSAAAAAGDNAKAKRGPSSLLSALIKPHPSTSAATGDGPAGVGRKQPPHSQPQKQQPQPQRMGSQQAPHGTVVAVGDNSSSIVSHGTNGPETTPPPAPPPPPPPPPITDEQRRHVERSHKVKLMIWKALNELCDEMAQLQGRPFAAPTSNRVSSTGINGGMEGTGRDGGNNSGKASNNYSANDDGSNNRGIDTSASFLKEYRAASGPPSLPSSAANNAGTNQSYEFFDLDEAGNVVLPPKIPMFPEDFPVNSDAKPWPLHWWGIVDPELQQGKETKAEQRGEEKESFDDGPTDVQDSNNIKGESSVDVFPTRRGEGSSCSRNNSSHDEIFVGIYEVNESDASVRPRKREREDRERSDPAPRRPRPDIGNSRESGSKSDHGPSGSGLRNSVPGEDRGNDSSRTHHHYPPPPPHRGGDDRHFPVRRGWDGPGEVRPHLHNNRLEGGYHDPPRPHSVVEPVHPTSFRPLPSGPHHPPFGGRGPPPSNSSFRGGGGGGGSPHRPLHPHQREPFHNDERRGQRDIPRHDPGPLFGPDDRPPYNRNDPPPDRHRRHPPAPPFNDPQQEQQHRRREDGWDPERDHARSPNRRREPGPRRPAPHGEVGEDGPRSAPNRGGRGRTDDPAPPNRREPGAQRRSTWNEDNHRKERPL